MKAKHFNLLVLYFKFGNLLPDQIADGFQTHGFLGTDFDIVAVFRKNRVAESYSEMMSVPYDKAIKSMIEQGLSIDSEFFLQTASAV